MAEAELKEEPTSPRKTVTHQAFRRFGARSFDYISFGALLEILGAPKDLSWYVLYWAAWIPFEAASLALFRTTPGKYLFDLRLTWRSPKCDLGERLYSSGRRAIEVWIFGIGCGIPVVSLAAMAFGLARLWERGTSKWDDDAGTTVLVSSAAGWIRPISAISILVVMVSLL